MKTFLRALIPALALALLLACSDGPRELYESAALEDKQRNYEHAAELYEEIVQKYPASEYAPQARQRLQEIKGTHP